MFIIGNGSSSEPKNAFRVTASESILANAEYNSTGADYAELFEWLDSNINEEDRKGLFVTLDGDKIRLANLQDTYILGAVSGDPSVVGDNFDDDWCNKYLTDVLVRLFLRISPSQLLLMKMAILFKGLMRINALF